MLNLFLWCGNAFPRSTVYALISDPVSCKAATLGLLMHGLLKLKCAILCLLEMSSQLWDIYINRPSGPAPSKLDACVDAVMARRPWCGCVGGGKLLAILGGNQNVQSET